MILDSITEFIVTYWIVLLIIALLILLVLFVFIGYIELKIYMPNIANFTKIIPSCPACNCTGA